MYPGAGITPAASLLSNASSANLVQTSRTCIPSKHREVEPLGSELREEMRKELRRSWYTSRESLFSEESRRSWTSCPAGYMLSTNGSASASHPVYPSRLLRFCDKPTVLYWAHSAQMDYHCPRFIWGCTYKEWFRCYNRAPRLDFEHFIANQVCITSTGPTTI